MWSLITLTTPEHPPTGKHWTDSRGNEVREPSYGTYILEPRFNHFDRQLGELIVRCMAHSPKHRPSMPEVERRIQTGIASISVAEQGNLRTWTLDYSGNPP
jgi:hypothetical protein